MRLLTLCLFLTTNTMIASEISKIEIDGTVEGQIKLFYYDINKQSGDDAYATSLGGYLGYTTNTNKQLYASIKFHNSTSITTNKNKKLTQLFNNDKNGQTLTTLSESYIALHNNNQEFKAGNMMLNTPMMNDDTTRTVPWSYQGFTYNADLTQQTQIQIYHITKIRSHTSDKYKEESPSGEIGSGITMLNISYRNDSLTLQSYYYYAPDLYSTFIAQADYKLRRDDETFFCFGAQYFNSGNGGKYAQRENRNGGDDIDLLAFRVGYNAKKWIINLNYSQNFGLSGIVKGYGGLAKVYTTSMVANGRGNYKPETWMFKTLYNLDENEWGSTELAFWLTNTRVKDSRGDNFDAYYLHLKHNFDTTSSIYFRYENIHHKNTNNNNIAYFRVISEYKF